MPNATNQQPASGNQDPAPRIDSHQHFWKYNPVRDAWITDTMKVIQHDFLPEDLAPLLKNNRIDGCVAVQADQSVEETHFLLELAARHDFIKGVVGWVNLKASHLEERLDYFSQFKKLKGFRHIVQAEPEGFLLRQDFSRGINALKHYGYTYDILIFHHQLADVVNFVKAQPDQALVIDHLAKPLIRDQKISDWSKHMKELAHYPNIMCKLSGMVTEADWNQWQETDFWPYMDVILDCFGPGRIMYGSDWPVCLLAASYEQQLDVVDNFISTLSESEKQRIMGGNAIRFYNL